MAAIPRLSPAAENRLLKIVCGLPPWLVRRLFGGPVEIDGQTLAPDIQALLGLAKLAGSESFTEGVPVETARRHRLREAEVVAERPPLPMARVEAAEIPGPAGPIPGSSEGHAEQASRRPSRRRCSSTSTAAAG